MKVEVLIALMAVAVIALSILLGQVWLTLKEEKENRPATLPGINWPGLDQPVILPRFENYRIKHLRAAYEMDSRYLECGYPEVIEAEEEHIKRELARSIMHKQVDMGLIEYIVERNYERVRICAETKVLIKRP